MAQRRMFSLSILDSDAFLDMPLSTQALYVHLAMRADDDGFVNNPRRIQRLIGASDDDFKLLILKRFLLVFESGIVVIKHWKMNNYIQKDRYTPTIYQEELKLLSTKENKSYTECIQNGYISDTQVSKELGKSKDSIDKSKKSIESGHLTAAIAHAQEKCSCDVKFDWSDYSEQEMTERYPFHDVKMTIAQVDMLSKHISTTELFDSYIYKIHFYPNAEDQFRTIVDWAIKDNHWNEEAVR